MDTLRREARDLLEHGEVQVVIGLAEGTSGTKRPAFVRKPEDADRLILDEHCTRNLAVYATKPDVKRIGRPALVACPNTQRSILQLMAERQILDGEVVVLAVDGTGVKKLCDALALEAHLALKAHETQGKDRGSIERLTAMAPEERWSFWRKAFEDCMKCYACRGACPMCYCRHCTMDGNRPQWVPVASHLLGNFEYHAVRTMHLAGRCVGCGECGRACPLGIPVHLLAHFSEDSTARLFGTRAGLGSTLDYALSSFSPDDQESFIR